MEDISMEKVSMIIPVWNIRAQLEGMLQSAARQTHKNLEIILVDDGSDDGSGAVCSQWAAKDRRVRCIHQKHAGVSAARNAGFGQSSGSYILFVDGDDEIAPDMAEKLLRRLIESGADASYCGFLNILGHKTVRHVPKKKVLTGRGTWHALVTDLSFFTAVWNKMFRREVLLDGKGEFIGFTEGIAVGEDELWLSKVLENVKKAAAVPEPLYYWKRRSNSATKGGAIKKTDAEYLSILDIYRRMAMGAVGQPSRRILCKKYLGACRDCMVQAYREHNYGLRDTLAGRIASDRGMYGRRDLFTLKLGVGMFLFGKRW